MASSLRSYYQNTRGLRTKADECLRNICSSAFNIICLTETWLLDEISSNSYFPSRYTVHRRDRDYAATGQKFGGGVIVAVDSYTSNCRRYDLETYAECVWVELVAADGFNYLIGNYYVPPLSDATAFVDHFERLEKQIDFSKFRVHLYGDFNLPGVDWESGQINSGNSENIKKYLV